MEAATKAATKKPHRFMFLICIFLLCLEAESNLSSTFGFPQDVRVEEKKYKTDFRTVDRLTQVGFVPLFSGADNLLPVPGSEILTA
jgi:hypothetical protein